MTPESQRIITPLSMEFATGSPVVTGLTGEVEHLAEFDLVLVAPATASTLSKIAHGISDNPVTALLLSTRARIVLAPAMHGAMEENPILKANLKTLQDLGMVVVG